MAEEGGAVASTTPPVCHLPRIKDLAIGNGIQPQEQEQEQQPSIRRAVQWLHNPL